MLAFSFQIKQDIIRIFQNLDTEIYKLIILAKPRDQ